jgi:pimeloyl-ACP methyl ester carboxylesterase
VSSPGAVRSTPWRLHLASVAVAVAVVAGACSTTGGRDEPTGSSARPPATTGSDTSPTAPAEGPRVDVAWEPCGGGFECGSIEVPLDYDDPGGPTIEIGVNRRPADDPDARVGVLLMNPGGPGGSGLELARQFPRAGVLAQRFDLVGFDPRGVGASTPLDCRTHLQAMYDADPTIDEPADAARILATSRDFVDECKDRHGELLAHLGTTDVARDIDEVRKALGESQINYLGYSYGTSIGQEYARLFPERVRAMILDGLVDHAPDGIATATAQAVGFERALDAYVANCAAQGCGLGRPADDAVDAVIDAAERSPIPAPGADRPATPGVVSLALAQSLYAQVLWGSLSAALRAALEGDGTGLVDLADQYLGREGDTYAGGFEVYFAVSCLDEVWPEEPEDFFREARRAAEVAPIFGEAIVNDYVRCALWPADAAPLAPVPADLDGLAPILVVSTTNDPATPHENGVAVAQQIPGAVLLTNEGEGHTIVGQGKPCIDDLVFAYLTDLALPADGTTCR